VSGAFDDLIAALDDPYDGHSDDACFALGEHGHAVLEPLIAAVPNFGRLGKMQAIELFEAIGDPRAAPTLIDILIDDEYDHWVWGFAAEALGTLESYEAVPALRSVYERERRRATPPDTAGLQRIRDTLTTLGARREVLPRRVAECALDDAAVGRCWLPADLDEVIAALADAEQLVYSLAFWQRWRDSRTWVGDASWDLPDVLASGRPLDWRAPWDVLVRTAQIAALQAADRARKTPELSRRWWDRRDAVVAKLDWFDESDR
jgi:HEAT repeat protein